MTDIWGNNERLLFQENDGTARPKYPSGDDKYRHAWCGFAVKPVAWPVISYQTWRGM